MIGTIANTCTILLGSFIGSVFKKGIKKEHQDALYTAMGLAATGLGINAVVQNMPNSTYPVLFIASLAIGSLIGTIIDVDGHFQKLADRLSVGELSKGLSTGIAVTCRLWDATPSSSPTPPLISSPPWCWPPPTAGA